MKLGTPLSPAAIKVMLLGSGELGKEVVIELQRLGVETEVVPGGHLVALGHPHEVATTLLRLVGALGHG